MMRKTNLLLCLTILILIGCKNEKPSKYSYYWVSFRYKEYKKADTINILQFDQSVNGDTAKVIYVTKFGYTDYRFVNGKDTAFIISNIIDDLVHPNDSIIFSRKLRDTLIRTGADSFKVSEYIFDEDVQDGGGIYYFTPKIGVYASHSNTWPGIRYLQSNDTVLNGEIMNIMQKTIPGFFLRGKLNSDTLKVKN
jgi:hypothetical protein